MDADNNDDAVLAAWNARFSFFTTKACKIIGPDKMRRIMLAMDRKQEFVFEIFKKNMEVGHGNVFPVYHTPFTLKVEQVIKNFTNKFRNASKLPASECMDISAHERFVVFLEQTKEMDKKDEAFLNALNPFRKEYLKAKKGEKKPLGSHFADSRMNPQLLREGYFRLEEEGEEPVVYSKTSPQQNEANYPFPPLQSFLLIVWFILYLEHPGEVVLLETLKKTFENRYRFWSPLFGVFSGPRWWDSKHCAGVRVKAWLSSDTNFPGEYDIAEAPQSEIEKLDTDEARRIALLYYLASPPLIEISTQQISPLASPESEGEDVERISHQVRQLDVSNDED